MNITESKVNDEITYQGDRYIVTKTPKRLGDKGEAAHLVRIPLLPSDKAGVQDDGTLEFGTTATNSRDLPDTTDVELVRSGVQYRTSADYVTPCDGGNLTAEDLKREREGVARSELIRVSLRRAQRAREAGEEDSMFRRGVKKAVEAGLSVAEVREQTGLSRERVYQIRDGRR